MTLKWMPAKAYGGPLKPTVVVVHCTESDNNAGTAESLAGPNWFGGPAGTSAHKMFDRDSGVEMVKRNVVAYHAGPAGNTVGVSYEFCGRAGWSAAKWREPAQLQMLRNAAPHIAEDLKAIGAPARWLSLAQLAAKQRGMCTHNDIRLSLGGTTHSDPGPNFPYAELLDYVTAAMAGRSVTEEELSMADIEELKRLIVGYGTRTELTQAEVSLIAQRQVGYGRRTENTEARVVALEAALNALAANSSISEAGLKNAVAEALRENVVTVNVDVAPGARTS